MVNIFTSPCFIFMALGSKRTFCWSQSAMRLFTLLSQIKKSTYLSPNYTVAAIFLKITAQSFPQVVYKMTK